MADEGDTCGPKRTSNADLPAWAREIPPRILEGLLRQPRYQEEIDAYLWGDQSEQD